MNDLEFGTVKSLRKSLLISSLIAFLLIRLVKYSSGELSFLGFNIPLKDGYFLVEYNGYIIIFFVIALIIRFGNQNFQIRYKERLSNITPSYHTTFPTPEEIKRENIKESSKKTIYVFQLFILLLDIIFPILLGLIAIYFSLISPLFCQCN